MKNQTMTEHDPLENLLPSLFQCFSVIFIGYLAVKLSLITSESKALGTYVTKFALPALFFRSMATINFYNVNWLFILAVSIGKFLLFIVTVIFTLLITKPINFGMAGILSMFITQSNDVALGYPILLSLYPELANYIYLFAPTQLVFINPLCFILLEWHEYRTTSLVTSSIHTSLNRRILLVLKNVILNPLVYMTVIGVIFNFILSHHLPLWIDKPLEILADSFSGVALFYLGMNMVDKLKSITKKGIYILVFILLGKLIFLPFITRELVVHIVEIQLSSNQTLNYSLMSFLYGGLPTAPPVFLIANEFQIIPDVIATGLVLGTFLSGPLMFITGRVVTMVIASKYQYDNILQSTAISVSSFSIFGCVWVLVVFILSQRCKSPVHRVTICYSICVLLSCFGLVIGRMFLPNSVHQIDSVPGWGNYVQFAIFFIGCTGARLWTCLIALSLVIVKKKSICFLLKNLKFFYLFGICVPILVTASILIFAEKQKTRDIDPSFQYGRLQLLFSVIILALCIVLTILFLILQVRLGFLSNIGLSSYSKRINNCNGENQNHGIEDEDLLTEMCHNEAEICPDRETCRKILHKYGDSITLDEMSTFLSELDEEFQLNRHLVLVILLVVTMGFGFFLCLWRLINEVVSGIYIELEFLDCVFNFGQGFILWAIFGLDTKLIVIPCKRKFKKIFSSFHELYIPKEKNLSPEVARIKNQFCQFHLDACRNEISKPIRQTFTLYQNVFTGRQLIDWILKADLEKDRLKAHAYGQALLISGIIEYVERNYNLIDSDDYLYRFLNKCEDSQDFNSNEITELEELESINPHRQNILCE